MSIGIAYNPCKNCKEMDKCSICELTYYRKGYIKSPTADVVEVVRCKDCKHSSNMPLGLCYLHTEPYENSKGYKGDAVCVEPDDFCSYGKRSEENEG